ncbi:glycosyl hydrolase family 8 [Cytophaga hutchinsonii]|nr:glycosyl hydrolase family 8 [Cytophaga hutchinsonii]
MKKRLLSAFIFVSLVFTTVCHQTVAQTQPFPANKTYSYGTMPGNKNSQDAINNYNTWKTNYVEACSNGRFRVKFDNRSQTVSEGIAYGMLLAAYSGDRTLFDGLWNYYKDNRNGNGVMNWKINGCSGTAGANGATDSEVDAAMALIVADYQWSTSGSINYKNDAKALITAIKNFEVESGSYVLKPGDQFGGSSLTNPSYFAPGYFRTFATYMNDTFWNNVADKCYVVINNNLSVNNAAGGLVSDWCTASGSYSSAAGGYANGGRNYSYDAARTPWRIAVDYVWYGNASAKTYSKKSSDFVRVNLGGSQNVKDGYSQNGSAVSNYHNSTFVGAFAAAAMAGENQSHLDNSYSDLKGINDANSYFNQTLKTLYLFLLTGNFYLPGSGTVVPPVNAAPTVSLTAPSNNAAFNAPASVTLTANAADADGTIAKVEFFNGSTLLNTDASAPYSFNWTNVAAGNYTITAKATDNAGAVTTSAAVSITVTAAANAAPTVSLTAPSNNAAFNVPASVTLTANAADADGTIAKVEFFNGSTLLNTDASAPYSFTWTGVAAGSYTITAKATDNAGAVTTSAAVSITVTAAANAAPTVSLTAPSNNAAFTAPASVTLTANAADADGTIAKVEFFNGSTLLSTDASAPYSFNWTGVAAGNYTITAKATDNTGAVTTSAIVSITVTAAANVAPTVSLTAPSNNAAFTAPASVTLTANAADADGTIAKVEFFNGSTLLSTDASAPYSFTWTNVAAGNYTITAKATDNAGAVTTSATVSITVTAAANAAPTVSLTAPTNNAAFTAPASVTLTANAADADGTIAKVEFFNGSTLLTGSVNTSAPYTFTWTGVAAGSYTITARATDNTGAVTTSAAVSITVTAAPIENPGNDCITEAVPVAAQWVVRNSWTDQNMGSKAVSTADALNIKHRQWGNPELWAIETGKAISVVSGQSYTVSFDFKNDAQTPVTSLEIGFATAEAWNGATLDQPAVTVSGSIPASFTTKTVTITAAATGTIYLAYKLKLNGQPNNEVNVFIKNISVCSSAAASSSAARPAAPAASNEVNDLLMGANPFADQTTVEIPYASTTSVHLIMRDMNGLTVWESYSLQTNQKIYLGSGLPIGTYLVTVSYDGNSKTFRLLKY